MECKRDEFNKHLTNNVVLRIDYVPIPDDLVDKINNLVTKKLLIDTSEFDETTQTFIRNIDIQMNDPSIQDFNDYINVKEKSKIKSYEYYKKENNYITIKITFNRQFCAIDVNQNIKYYNFEYYRDIFVNLLSVFKENTVIVNRFGLRKFNDFFIKKDTDINKYVKNKYFNFECDDLLENSDSFISEKRYTFANKDIKVNLVTHSSVGMMNEELVKRIAFDIDLYIDDIKKLSVLLTDANKDFIDRVNDSFFDIYVNLLEKNMIDLLKNKSDIEDENIICGVDLNE